MSVQSALRDQYGVVLDRKQNPAGGKSYTNYLYNRGLDQILKKCGEETFEAVIAVKSGDRAELLGELGDVLYHVTVMICFLDVTLNQVMEELNRLCQETGQSFDQLYNVIAARRGLPVSENGGEGSSYTAYLFQKGTDKILKKIGEACSLMLIAAKNGDKSLVASETAGLLYHIAVMMVDQKVTTEALAVKLDQRNGKTGNLKTFHQSDHTT